MNPQEVPSNVEAELELEFFRQQWKDEVSAKGKGKKPAASKKSAAASSSKSAAVLISTRSNAPAMVPQSHQRHKSVERTNGRPYDCLDLGEKQHGLRLNETAAQTEAALEETNEPQTALELYEKAVERESLGSLGDSVNLYRRAFRLDPKVHEAYRAKHFPPSSLQSFKPTATTTGPASERSAASARPNQLQDVKPSNASATVPNTAHYSIQGLLPSIQSLIGEFSSLSILGAPPPTDLSPPPPCPISAVPEEILVEVLNQLAVRDVAAFVRLAQVCKRLAYLVFTEDRVWKHLALGPEFGFAAMHYNWTCQVDGTPLGDDNEGRHFLGSGISTPTSTDEPSLPLPTLSLSLLTQSLVPTIYPTYRTLFRLRPRLRFNGCYISTVNYTRPGQSSPTSVSWNSPIHIVTYYRYLRFLRDGTCIILLTTSEPADTVPYLWIEHIHKNHGSLPSAPMKDAVLGCWRLTGPQYPSSPGSADLEGEKEGTLIIKAEGVAPKYMNKMMLSIGGSSRHANNNKLSWQGYWSYNRLTDDWAEYLLRNDRNRGFFFSKVKSYGMSWDERGMS